MKKITLVLLAFVVLSFTQGMPRAFAADGVGDFFRRLGGNQQITQLAQEIVDGATDEEDKAYAIYSWVASEIYYELNASGSVPTVLRTQVADCTGYTNLMKALLDAVGLENRRKRASIDAPWMSDRPVAHVWNEVKINRRWIHVDATWGHTYPDQYFDFGGHD
jgi:transglutaminase-like putative cysteine protease